MGTKFRGEMASRVGKQTINKPKVPGSTLAKAANAVVAPGYSTEELTRSSQVQSQDQQTLCALATMFLRARAAATKQSQAPRSRKPYLVLEKNYRPDPGSDPPAWPRLRQPPSSAGDPASRSQPREVF